MKKVLSLVCLLAVVASCLFVFASCGGGATPNSDPAKAKAALDAAGYTCQDGYAVTVGAAMSIGTEAAKKLENAVAAYKGSARTDAVSIYYFADEESAQLAYDYIDELASELDDYEGVYGISGKMVWAGAETAIKAAQ